MSAECYWISGLELELPEDVSPSEETDHILESIGSCTWSSGCKPGWVEEIHISAPGVLHSMLENRAPGEDINAPLIFHGSADTPPLFRLNAHVWSILSGERSLIIMVDVVGRRMGAALLASHLAVGRYNLMARARAAATLTLRESSLELLSAQLEKRGIRGSEVGVLAGVPSSRAPMEQSEPLFPQAVVMDNQRHSGVVYKLNSMLRALEHQSGKYAVLYEIRPQIPALALAFEQV